MPDFKPTLNLPDPAKTIPMKADLPRLEPQIQAKWAEERLYHRILDAHRNDPLFILHDGPPYTNSPIHIGTALNKILKDVVIKSRAMMGFRAPYIPGFDNHGLPIEQAVAKRFAEEKREPSREEFLQGCRDHAARYISVQTEQFRRLGVLGLWEDPYATMDFRFEAGVIRVFKRLVEGGYLYRGLRPTLWSPSLRSALADTEIVYRTVTSKAIYVAFPVMNDPNEVLTRFPGVRAIIWTTTPWTIPANLAIAFHPTFRYAVVRVGTDNFVVARELVEAVGAKLGWSDPHIVAEILGADFEHVEFAHPIFGRPSLGVLADYVTNEEGTGLVHTAPSHGRDDYLTGQRYGLSVPNTVSESGVLTDEAGEFAGTYYSACDTVVTERLHEVGALLSIEDYSHSYPHAERDEKPVIYRATDQWFIAMDENQLRERALAAVEDVQWIPPQGETRIRSMITNRPDWCVSRQRPWGVGIPILKTKEGGEPVLHPQVIEGVAQLVEKHGSGAWLAAGPSDFIPHGFEYEGEQEFVQETDVLDVWFDSGSTAINVLAQPVHPNWSDEGVHYPADLYLEGSDQHRGWFNSSLLLGLATQGEAPYRTVVTHGMVVDEEGRKMSKRLGNVVDPVAVCERFGADVLRLWVATVDWTNDAACSMAILEQTGGLYRDLRNPLRFLVGNIDDLPPDDRTELLPIDRWILERCELLCADVVAAYQSYNLSSVASSIHLFCRDDLSRVYLDAIKDRMYCEAKDSAVRRSGQRACLLLAERLVLLLAPILPHTAEEVYGYLRPYLGSSTPVSVHERNFIAPDETRLSEIAGSELQIRYAAAVELREMLNGVFEQWKGTDGIKAKKDAMASVPCRQDVRQLLAQIPQEELAIFTGFSHVELTEQVGDEQITLAASRHPECARSRLRRGDVREFKYGGESVMLTVRDARVLGII